MAQTAMSSADVAGPAALGMNCADDPLDLQNGEWQKLINSTVRSGRPETRPPFIERELTFDNLFLKNLYQTGKFQGCRQYTRASSAIVGISGHVFSIDIRTMHATEIASQVGLMSQEVDRFYFLDAGRFFILQDGLNIPIIIDNGVARKSDLNKVTPYPPDEGTSFRGEVPIGTHMATGHGRIAVTIPNTGQFVVGDIALPDDPHNMLLFTETDYPFTGGAFKIPEHFGPITAMAFQPTPDTSRGEGPLIVSGQGGISWYDISLQRSEWTATDISRTITVEHGGRSGDAFIPVNTDVLYYGRGEVRTIKQSVEDERTVVSLPYSREVRCWMEHNDPKLDHLVYGMYHRDRAFFLVAPEIICIEDRRGNPIADIRHKGMVVLDFQRVGGLESTNRPAYDGLWTGIHPTGMCSFRAIDRGFVFGKGDDGVNRMYEVGDDVGSRFDNNDRRIAMKAYPRRFGFTKQGQSVALIPKRFRGVEVWPTDVYGRTTFLARYRADDRVEWSDSGSAEFHVTSMRELDESFENMQPRSVQRLSLGGPDTSKCDEETGRAAQFGYQFDACVEVRGHAKLRAVAVRAVLDSEEEFSPTVCSETDERLVSALTEDDYEYSIHSAELSHE